jgi:hypothetical protein
VRAALESLGGETPLLLAPPLDGWIGVYPEGGMVIRLFEK